jgi:hypothetical protein
MCSITGGDRDLPAAGGDLRGAGAHAVPGAAPRLRAQAGRAEPRSLLAYGALVGRHGRLVERRWLRGERVDDHGLLSAPELGPVADTLTLYQAVAAFRAVPISRRTVLLVVAAAVLPMIPVVAIRVPIGQEVLKLIKTVM